MRVNALILIFAMALELALCPASAATGEGTYSIREYPLPPGAAEIGAMTVDGIGNVWLIQNDPPVLYKLVPANGTFGSYTIDRFAGARFTGLSVDETGIAWFTDLTGDRFGAYDERNNRTWDFYFHSWNAMAPSSIVRRGDTIWIGCDAEVGEYDLRTPDEPLRDHFVYNWGSGLRDIHFDRFGNVWFVEFDANKVGVYWRRYDRTSEFLIPSADAYPTCLSIDSQGRLWFVESATGKLGMFHTELFNFSEHEMPVIDGKKPNITDVATVGEAVWLTDMDDDRVLRFYPDESRLAAAQLSDGAMPTFIEPDANGTLWILEAGLKRVAALDVTDRFGQATPTPAATTQPTATATSQSKKTPGFLALISITALTLASYACQRRK